MANDPMETMHASFHAHLDKCHQCESEPFNLCPEGDKLVQDGLAARQQEEASGLAIGDRVEIRGEPWVGHKGTYAGTEETMLGVLHRVDLDNGFSTLREREEFEVVAW